MFRGLEPIVISFNFPVQTVKAFTLNELNEFTLVTIFLTSINTERST